MFVSGYPTANTFIFSGLATPHPYQLFVQFCFSANLRQLTAKYEYRRWAQEGSPVEQER